LIVARELGVVDQQAVSPLLAEDLTTADDQLAAAAYDETLSLVRAKLAINKPGYVDHGAVEEAGVVR